MNKKFSYLGSGKLLFGNEYFSKLQSEVNLEDSLLVCGNSFGKTDQFKGIKDSLKFQRTISGEPDPETIDSITAEVKGKIQSVIAVGGGSVLDAGKAIAAMCCCAGSVEDYLEGVGTKKPNGKTLPMIAIPTTAGTGSEATKNAVICRRGETGYKKSLRHDNYIPKLIIIDPQLYIHCPTEIMGSCGMDAFCQLLESYISTSANILSDALAWRGLTLFIENFSDLCLSENRDSDQMGHIAFAAYLSGITLANVGLGTVHGIAGPLGGFYPIPHGTACGTLLPEVMRRTIERLYLDDPQQSVIIKLENLGRHIKENSSISLDEKPALMVCQLIDQWLTDLEIPRLSQFGIIESDLENIATASGNKNNPIQFTKEEIKEIIKARL